MLTNRPFALYIKFLPNSMTQLDISDSRRVLANMGFWSSLLNRIHDFQLEDKSLVSFRY